MAAQAYTVGQNIVFAKGRYAPQSSAGRVIIAHELAHVAQQGSADSASFQGQILAREPAPSDPSDEDRLVDVERQLIQQQQQIQSLEQEQKRHEAIDAKRRQAENQILRQHNAFNGLIRDWQNAIYRIDYGIKAAKVGFEHAKLGQEKADELATQILLAAVTVGFALGFEPLLAAGLAKLGPKISESLDEFVEDLLGEGADIKELLENPAIESVGGASNIQSARSELPTPEPSTPQSQSTESNQSPLAQAQATMPPQGILEGYLNINFQVLNEKLTETDTKVHPCDHPVERKARRGNRKTGFGDTYRQIQDG